MFNRLALILTPLLLLGLYAEQRSFAMRDDSGPYHARVDAAIRSIPLSTGAWDSTQILVPEPAQKLLRPNAMFARQYRDRSSGRSASLIIIQCRDTRDLAGHYPPICYPGHGWTRRGQSEVSVRAGARALPARRYTFSRLSFDREARLVVYSLFVIPGRGAVPDMESVYDAASNYRTRPFGAAQVQVVLTEEPGADEERRIVAEVLGPAAEAIAAIETAGAAP